MPQLRWLKQSYLDSPEEYIRLVAESGRSFGHEIPDVMLLHATA